MKIGFIKLNNFIVFVNGGVKNQINYFFINGQGRFLDIIVMRGVKVNSDYFLVKIRIRICISKFKNKSKLRLILNVECFKKMYKLE